MKKILTILTTIFLSTTIWAQSPNKMSYQAVIRNNSDQLVVNKKVGMQISILQGSAEGTAVYTETQTPTTNANGLVSIEFGGNAGFDAIDWSTGTYFIKTETDPAGGTNYSITGTSQLLSVPYALYAKSSGNPGPQGEQGIKGDKGDQGIQGATGAKGDKGDTGLTGATGPQGSIGLTGPAGANNLTTSVNGVTQVDGAITLSKADIGLSNINNTSDLNKPISSATQSALDNKVDKVTGKNLAPDGTAIGQMQYWNGTVWVNVLPGSSGQVLTYVNGVAVWTGGSTLTNVVVNITTGKVWMDRNLGATQVATSSMDAASYGDLYQWGRGTDGHQIRTSNTTTTLSGSDLTGNSLFILPSISPLDWRSPQKDNLWQGASGINNPCPSGFRLPTDIEIDAERASWISNNAAGAFASPLKFPLAGFRNLGDGSVGLTGDYGRYWSSTVSGTSVRYLYFNSINASLLTNYRANGFSVRCIKD